MGVGVVCAKKSTTSDDDGEEEEEEKKKKNIIIMATSAPDNSDGTSADMCGITLWANYMGDTSDDQPYHALLGRSTNIPLHFPKQAEPEAYVAEEGVCKVGKVDLAMNRALTNTQANGILFIMNGEERRSFLSDIAASMGYARMQACVRQLARVFDEVEEKVASKKMTEVEAGLAVISTINHSATVHSWVLATHRRDGVPYKPFDQHCVVTTLLESFADAYAKVNVRVPAPRPQAPVNEAEQKTLYFIVGSVWKKLEKKFSGHGESQTLYRNGLYDAPEDVPAAFQGPKTDVNRGRLRLVREEVISFFLGIENFVRSEGFLSVTSFLVEKECTPQIFKTKLLKSAALKVDWVELTVDLGAVVAPELSDKLFKELISTYCNTRTAEWKRSLEKNKKKKGAFRSDKGHG